MKPTHFIVTGAPASGKTLTCRSLLGQHLPLMFFDSDELLPATSELTGGSLTTHQASWHAYRQLWMSFLDSVVANGLIPVLFMPISPPELHAVTQERLIGVSLLDCPNAVRRQRLLQRKWSEAAIAEALVDAEELRQQVPVIFDTGQRSPTHVAARLISWIQACLQQ